jgi:hypothetical protein
MRRFVVVGLLCGAAFLAPRMTFGLAAKEAAEASGAAGAATAAAIDLASLDLRFVEARAVDALPQSPTPLKPAKGEKLVVVTLRGKLPAPGRLTVTAAAFSALYSADVSKPGGPREEKVGKSVAQAVDLGQDDSWTASATNTYPKVKDVLIDIAMPLPAGAGDFYLLYDTAKGKQRLAVKMGAKGTNPSP